MPHRSGAVTGFKDHFSGHAGDYSSYRPGYPDALFDWLASQAPDRRHAWDCATGNGQAAVALARRFARVTATDASAEQIAQASPAHNITYRTAAAEDSGLGDASVDLVTVAQAAHWFDLPAFYREVRRVLRPGGVLALWCYGLARIDPAVDAVVEGFYEDAVGPWWPTERRHVETGYRELELPFGELAAPAFAMQAEWTLEHLLGYLGSWSATRRCAADTGRDPITELAPALADAWGDAQTRVVSWPLAMRVARA